MRSEKDQTTASREKGVVEIRFRDIPREQDNTPGSLKQKEEKKEVFTKVGGRTFATVFTLLITNMEDGFSTADSVEGSRRSNTFHILFTFICSNDGQWRFKQGDVCYLMASGGCI